eukprot:gene9124-11180_t
MNEKKDFIIEIISGSLSGALTRMLIAPLDVVKIRFQLQNTPKHSNIKPKYTNIYQCLKTVIREEGIRSLWKGNLSAEFLWISYASVQFSSYNLVTGLLDPKYLQHQKDSHGTGSQISHHYKPSPIISFISGGLTGVLSTTATYPFDIIRTNIINEHQKTTITQTYRKIIEKQGTMALYKGLNSSLLQIVPQMALQFTFYETFKHMMIRSSYKSVKVASDDPLIHFLGGAAAGGLSKFFVLPFDVVKKRLQVSSEPLSIGQCITRMYHQEGWKSFFKGGAPSILKAGIASALTFLFYEQSKLFFFNLFHFNFNKENN